ncbi:hypothetical protein N493_19860 (plasmid) [Clostridium botulinum B2 433]|uniref:hypothetical protein n=1 Tax=Clostridium botulinum TaxID=1491 RepID=UPI0007E1FD88|nr:hypothetical protein [Clostridium botulinum]KEI84145.1 hypothetical protein N493_19860 [Clostridium botulinum B2 433]
MGKPKYQNYRVCYEHGNKVTGKEIYELHKYCDCQFCKDRVAFKKNPANRATAITKDISKVDEVAEFLKNWTCGNSKMDLKISYFQF